MSTTTQLTPKQNAFLSRHLRGGFFNKKKDKATTASYLNYDQLEGQFKALAAEIPRENPEMVGLIQRLPPVIEAKNGGRFEEAAGAIGKLVEDTQALKLRIGEQRTRMVEETNRCAIPGWASPDLVLALNAEKQKATTALAAPLPKPAEFDTARVALDAFANLRGQAEVAVKQRRQRLLGTTLADPPYAAPAALFALQAKRDKRARALKDELPAPQNFTAADEAIAAFKEAVEAEKQRVKQARITLLGTELLDPPYADKAAVAVLKTERDKRNAALTDELPTPAQITAAEQAIVAFNNAVAAEKKRVTDRRNALLAALSNATDPDDAPEETVEILEEQRQEAGAALRDEAPTPAEMETAERAVGELDKALKIFKIAAGNPKAAEQLVAAFLDFKNTIGDTEPTPELIAEAAKQRSEASKARTDLAADLKSALADYKKARKLPATTPQEKERKRRAIEATANAHRLAKNQSEAADAEEQRLAARENALVGTKSLTEAIRFGALSPDAGRPFKPETAEKLIAAYSKDGRLADAALRAASTAKFPDELADNLDALIGHVKGGFASADGVSFRDQEYSRTYGERLMKMGGEVGSEFFSRMPDYLASGKQFAPTEFEHAGAGTFPKLAQKRSVSLAGKLMKTDGTLDLASDDAKNAIGDMLFHPKVLRNAMPAMNAYMLKTLQTFSDPVTGRQANSVLTGITAPTSPGAQTILRTSLDKGGTDAVDAKDARTSVLASMLKPLDQGPVGSCFATAPARLMRETQPIEAMKAFAEIASKGTCKPPNGPEVPAVTNTPPGEDPLMRSWEYSLATSTARSAGSRESSTFATRMGPGIEQLKDLAIAKEKPEDKDKEWVKKKKKLTADVAAAFTFTYDPLSKVTDANDGSSSQGRYVIVPVGGGAPIVTRDAFVEAIGKVALASLGIDPGSDDADPVRNLVGSDPFVNAVCPGKYKPWELASGGFGDTASKTLFGDSQTRSNMRSQAPKTPPPPEGARTAEVLTSFLGAFDGSGSNMVTIETIGMHSFNALPQHPSLAPLKAGGSSKFAQNVQDKLVQPGTALKNTEIPPDQAGWMFDQEIQKAVDGEQDEALKTVIRDGAKGKRPTGPMKPAAITAAVKAALESYHEQVADKRAKKWEEDEKSEGRNPGASAVTKKKTDLKAAFDKNAEGSAKTLLMRQMGAPEFVIADTNWGDSRSHTFFVIAPDPTTGEPTLWKKQDPPGSLQPAGRDWVDAQWVHIQ